MIKLVINLQPYKIKIKTLILTQIQPNGQNVRLRLYDKHTNLNYV